MIDRITVDEDPAIDALVPAMAAQVEVDAGDVHERRIAHGPRGEPDDPLEWDELITKFDGLAAIGYDADRRARIVALVRNLDAVEDVRALTALLGA